MAATSTLTSTVEHWIGGKLARHANQRTQNVFNPATGEVARQVIIADRDDVGQAVLSAATAFPSWSDTPPIRRARVLNRFLALMNEHRDALAAIITQEHGKVFADAQGEVMRGIDIVEFACGIPQLLKGDFTDRSLPGLTIGPCGNPWAWSRVCHRSIFLAWCLVGCSRWPSRPATHSC